MLDPRFPMQVSTINIVIIVVFITCIFFIAAASLLIYVRLYNERKRKHLEEKKMMSGEFEKQLMQSQLETREETFHQLGEELHDNIGQLLNSTKLLIGVAQRSIPDPPDTLITANETLAKAIQELRSLSKSLNKEWLEQFNFLENLQAEISRINSAKTIHLRLTSPDSLPLQADQQIILFRIVQEVLQNAIKHADAQNIFINITKVFTALTITISDDGSGFNESGSANGVGLLNIRHRTNLLGGSVLWQSSKDKGTVVIIQLPVNPPES